MNRFIFLIIILFLFSCNDSKSILHVTDYYYVYDNINLDYNGNRIDAQQVFMCKLACKNDPFIKNVTNVQWNDSIIIVKNNLGHFVIKSNSYGLCCCCSNKVIGPFDEEEIEIYKTKNDLLLSKERQF